METRCFTWTFNPVPARSAQNAFPCNHCCPGFSALKSLLAYRAANQCRRTKMFASRGVRPRDAQIVTRPKRIVLFAPNPSIFRQTIRTEFGEQTCAARGARVEPHYDDNGRFFE